MKKALFLLFIGITFISNIALANNANGDNYICLRCCAWFVSTFDVNWTTYDLDGTPQKHYRFIKKPSGWHFTINVGNAQTVDRIRWGWSDGTLVHAYRTVVNYPVNSTFDSWGSTSWPNSKIFSKPYFDTDCQW